jgi:acyl-CoA thioesterase
MDKQSTYYKIAKEKMYNNDAFSKWLGIEIIDLDLAYCKVKMKVRAEMLNGFQISHGGISYSFADSAFAFASNSLGRHAVSIETSISHTKAIFEGDELTAEASLLNKSRSLAVFSVNVLNQNNDIVALFKGTVFFKGDWQL